MVICELRNSCYVIAPDIRKLYYCIELGTGYVYGQYIKITTTVMK